MRLAVAMALIFVAAERTAAESVWHAYTGERLLEVCRSTPLLCDGYILGMVDARYDEGTFCLTGDVRTRRIVDTVKRYLEDHPEFRRVDASALVGDALKEEFPCN